MGRSRVNVPDSLRSGREWLRSRGPVALAAALLLQVSAATAVNGTGAAGLLRAALLVVLLLGVLIAAAIDSVVTSAALAALGAGDAARRWTRVTVLGLAEPLDLTGVALLDRAGKPLRGGARNARIALLERQHTQQTYARSLRGRAEVVLAELRRVAQPLSRRAARVGLALESRVLALRAAVIARSLAVAAWTGPLASGALGLVRSRTTLLWQATRARLAPALFRTRMEARPLAARLLLRARVIATASFKTARAGYTGSVAVARAIPVPSIPLPSMSTRALRAISLTLLMSFIFATVIGTTGLVATRGSIALGASTTLAIISGEVSVLDQGATDFQPAVDGQVLGAGSTVRTGADSYAVLTYFEGSTVSLDPNTVLVIEALEASPDGSTIIGMRQDLGRTWHSVTTLLTAGSKYEVKTSGATATVRGTSFLVGVQRSADLGLPETVIETTEGAVAAERAPTPEAPEGEEIIVPAGFQVRAVQAAPIPPAVPAPEPERKVTVTVEAGNSVVVDPQGRANGEVNGRIVVQTPGATVEKVDGRLVVTLPNTTDGKIRAVVQPEEEDEDEPERPRRRVRVETVVEERGKGESRVEETIEPENDATGVTGVEVTGSTDQSAPPGLRRLEESEKEAPPIKVSQVPAAEAVALALSRVDDRGSEESRDESEAVDGEGDDGDVEGDDGDGGDGGNGNGQGGPAGASGAGGAGEGQDSEGSNDRAGESSGDRGDRPQGIVNAIVTLTLPPLSAEELALRERQKREADERERRERDRNEERRRQEEQQKIDELRRQEAEARARAERLGGERLQEEGRRDVRREGEDRRGEEDRREEERQGNAPAAPIALLQQVFRAVAPADREARQGEDDRVDHLKKQEEEARKAAERAAEEARRAEQRLRQETIRAEEEKAREAARRAEELRRAEARAKEDEARKLAELARIEAKAREQASKLEADQRREAERRLAEFREAEERKRRDAAQRLEDQRRAEEGAKEEAERRLRELRRQEEQARESERERDREEDRDESERRDRGGFVPKVELKGPPGVGGNSVEDEDRSEQRRERNEERQQERGAERDAEREKRDS